MRSFLFAAVIFFAAFVDGYESANAEETGWSEPAIVDLEGVKIHYVERGKGVPIVFLHGSLADYREWAPVADELRGYRRILYSRRYNWPNENAATNDNHSAQIEATDLAALIQSLELGPVHLVGASYGGYTALVLALTYPELVRTLTLAEPALVGWLPNIEGGTEIYQDFQLRMWRPSAAAAKKGNAETSIRIALDYLAFEGIWDTLPPDVRAETLRNQREWTEMVTSSDAFPDKDPSVAVNLQMPLVLISGEKTLALHKLIDADIVARRPATQRIIIPETTHQVCSEEPLLCADAVRSQFEH